MCVFTSFQISFIIGATGSTRISNYFNDYNFSLNFKKNEFKKS